PPCVTNDDENDSVLHVTFTTRRREQDEPNLQNAKRGQMTSSERSDITSYDQAGVDTEREEAGLARLVGRITKTWQTTGVGKVELPVGYFANVIEIGGTGLAVTADGGGTKRVVAQMLARYDP